MGFNKVEFIGRLKADPEGGRTSNGQRSTSMLLIDRYPDHYQRDNILIKGLMTGRLATVAKKYLKAGDRLYVSGELASVRPEDEDNGKIPHRIRIIQIIMLGIKTRVTRHDSKKEPQKGEAREGKG